MPVYVEDLSFDDLKMLGNTDYYLIRFSSEYNTLKQIFNRWKDDKKDLNDFTNGWHKKAIKTVNRMILEIEKFDSKLGSKARRKNKKIKELLQLKRELEVFLLELT